MSETKKCSSCGGSGTRSYLKSAHDDETVESTCTSCKGSGEIHYMSDEDEADYHADFW